MSRKNNMKGRCKVLVMGMYTELVLGMCIKPKTSIIKTLEYMLGESDIDPRTLYMLDHPLFKSERWEWMLRSTSAYFDGSTQHLLTYDELLDEYHLNVRCDLKNYSQEIEKFLDWLCPYILTEGFLGYMRYEEFDYPTLIYRYDSTIYTLRV